MAAPWQHRTKPSATTLIILAVAILIGPSSAGAQSVVDQYVPEIDRGGASPDAGAGPTVSSAGPTATSDGGATKPKAEERVLTPKEGATDSETLPGSDFPLTSFVVALAILVMLALVARLLLPVLGRRFAD